MSVLSVSRTDLRRGADQFGISISLDTINSGRVSVTRPGDRRVLRWSPFAATLQLVFVLLAAVLLGSAGARAQAPGGGGLPGAAAGAARTDTINPDDLIRHAIALGHDSLRDRIAPSAALERTARYVAGQFERLGLTPGGNFGSWFQRYPIPRYWVDDARSRVAVAATLMARGKNVVAETGAIAARRATAGFDAAAYFAPWTAVVPAGDRYETRPTFLIAGRHTVASLRQLDLHNAQVLFVPPADQDSVLLAPVLKELRALSHGVVVLRAIDSATFTVRLQDARRLPRRLTSTKNQAAFGPWAAEVWPPALAPALAAADVNLAELRRAVAPLARPLPFVAVQLATQVDSARVDTTTVPNVVARLEGTDSQLNGNPIVISAHLEHTGHGAVAMDGVTGRPDRSAGEVVSLLALAEAVVRSGLQPRRPIIFLASSGGIRAADDWGSNAFIFDRWGFMGPRIGLALALEQFGEPGQYAGTGGPDTLWVSGSQELELPRPIAWTLAAHPELPLTLAEESPSRCPAAGCWQARSAFGALRIPSLAVNSGYLIIEPSATDQADQVAVTRPRRTADREARILQFVYYLVAYLANERAQPVWSSQNRDRLPGLEPKP